VLSPAEVSKSFKPTTKNQQLTTNPLVLAVRCTTICAPVGAHCSTLTYFTAHTSRIPHPQLLLHPNPSRCKRLIIGCNRCLIIWLACCSLRAKKRVSQFLNSSYFAYKITACPHECGDHINACSIILNSE